MALSLAVVDHLTMMTTTDTATDTTTDTTTTTTTPTSNGYVLTSGMDTVTGGSGDDYIYATVSGAATTTTLKLLTVLTLIEVDDGCHPI